MEIIIILAGNQKKSSSFFRGCCCFTLFLIPVSRHNFESKQNTTESCISSPSEIELLKNYVKGLSKKQNRHPNSIWAELKRKYDFYSYKQIDCETMKKIKNELNLNILLNKIEYIQSNKKNSINL